MASDESMTVRSCISMQEDAEFEDDLHDHDHDHDHHPHHNFSRLSVCTSSSICGADDIDDDMGMYMSHLSIESFDGDVEDELSDGKPPKGVPGAALSSDSDDKESVGCYSLPATPPRRRTRAPMATAAVLLGKECVSENEAAAHDEEKARIRRQRRRMRRRIMRERLLGDRVFWEMKELDQEDHDQLTKYTSSNTSCQSDQSQSQAYFFTRPKGGNRSLRMDIDEVKACRELGFELELDNINIHPLSTSTAFDTASTASGGNSPVSANWRISSPGIYTF